MKVELNKRDLELLKNIFESRILTFEQIGQKFFANRDKSTSRKRINKLFQNGLLKKRTVDLPDRSRKAALLTERAWSHIQQKWDFEIENPHFKTESPEHDILLTDIIQKLRRLKSFREFFSENLLQSSQALSENQALKEATLLQSDGALIVEDAESTRHVFALEFELNRKSPERYQEKLHSYHQTEHLAGVLYLCSNNEVMNAIERAEKLLNSERIGFVHFALQKNVLNADGLIKFRSLSGEGIELF